MGGLLGSNLHIQLGPLVALYQVKGKLDLNISWKINEGCLGSRPEGKRKSEMQKKTKPSQ